MKCAAVGELIIYQLSRQIPAYKQTCEKSADGKEYLPREKVEYAEKRCTEKLQAIILAERQRTCLLYTSDAADEY